MIFVKNSMCVKNTFVKNRVGGRGVNLNLDNVCKYTVCFFDGTPKHLDFGQLWEVGVPSARGGKTYPLNTAFSLFQVSSREDILGRYRVYKSLL